MRVTRLTWIVPALAVSGCATTYNAKWDEKPVTAAAAATAPTEVDATKALQEKADALWAKRDDKQSLTEAIAAYEQLAEKAPSADLFARLSRAHYLLADGFFALEGNTEARDNGYQKGLDWATKSLKAAAPAFAEAMAAGKKHPEAIQLAGKEAVPGMYWYATNLGKWAASKGFATRLRYKDDAKSTMDRVKALDAGFFYSAPLRYFGSFEALTVGIAGGSLVKSEEFFTQAVAAAPNYLGSKVLWADYLCTKKQDKATFVKLLNEVISADAKADPEVAPENLIEQVKAKKLLADVDEKF
jgi:hypothetical protein